MSGSPPTHNRDTVLSHALCYAKRGWRVFPAPSNAKKSYKAAKHSNGANWGATIDASEIERDFKRWPDAGVGIVTGSVSGIFVVEADTVTGHGVDGLASLRALEAQHGKLPETLAAESPSGSQHFYFTYPPGVIIKNSTSALGAGIDVRGDGGMVIAPPSVRPDVGAYRWLNDNPIADAPQWLMDLVKERAAERAPSAAPTVHCDNARVIEDELLLIDPDIDRNTWFQIGCALFSECGDQAGFALWDQWSSNGAKYKPREMEPQWRSIVKASGYDYTIDTVFKAVDAATLNDDAHAAVVMVEAWVASLKTLPKTDLDNSAKRTTITQVGEWVRNFGDAADPLIEDADGGEIIGRAQAGVLYGPAGTGKTAIANEMAFAVATGAGMGAQFLEKQPLYRSHKGRVLVAIYEDPFDYRRRLLALAKARAVDLNSLNIAIVSADLNVTKEKDRAALLQRIRTDAASKRSTSIVDP